MRWRTIKAQAVTSRGSIVHVIAEQKGYRFEVRPLGILLEGMYQSERLGSLASAKSAAEALCKERGW